MTPLQQLQEEYENIYSPIIGTIWSTDSDSIQRYKQTMNYIEKAFTLGQLSGIELSEECIPEEIKYIDPSGEKIYYQDNLAEQFNKCRTESLTNLSDLKKNIHGEA